MNDTMEITFPGGDKVDATYRGRTVSTDQQGDTPRPFDLFLASIGTCAGIYVANFCRQRRIPTENLRLRQHMIKNPETRMIERIELEIDLPPEVPERYHAAVIRAAELCAVKKHLAQAPAIEVRIAATPPVP